MLLSPRLLPSANLRFLVVSISSLVVTNPRKRSTINIVPNAFPANILSVTRASGDVAPIEYVQVRSCLADCASLDYTDGSCLGP